MKVLKLMREIFYVLGILIIVCAACCFIFKLKPAIVMSGSMEPSIHVGSVAVVKQGASFELGDPIAFYWGNEYVTHRLIDSYVEGGETLYITKGDANNTEDPQRINKDNVDGKVLFSIPLVGYALHFSKSRRGLILLGTIMICLILSLFMNTDDRDGESDNIHNPEPVV